MELGDRRDEGVLRKLSRERERDDAGDGESIGRKECCRGKVAKVAAEKGKRILPQQRLRVVGEAVFVCVRPQLAAAFLFGVVRVD
jgi:hypothetical protein